jgi:hypothetical protein
MDKTSGRNFVIRFFPKSLAIGQKSSKTIIALEGKPISAYPLRVFLLSLGPTYGQDITSKAIYKLVTLPRQKGILSMMYSKLAYQTLFFTSQPNQKHWRYFLTSAANSSKVTNGHISRKFYGLPFNF